MTPNVFKLEKIQPVPHVPGVWSPCDTLGCPEAQLAHTLEHQSPSSGPCTPEGRCGAVQEY